MTFRVLFAVMTPSPMVEVIDATKAVGENSDFLSSNIKCRGMRGQTAARSAQTQIFNFKSGVKGD